jgi:fucose permease
MSDNIILAGVGLLLTGPVVYFLVIHFPKPEKKEQVPLKDLVKLFRNSILIFSGFILFLESGIEGVINNWTTTFLQHGSNLDKQEALFSLSSFVLSLSLTRFVLGLVLKRTSSSLILLIGTGITACGLMILFFSDSFIISLLSMFLLGIGCAAVFPLILSYVGEIFSKISGTAFSIVMVIAVTGNILINYFMGLVAHWVGIDYFIAVLLLSLIIMLVLLILFLNRIKQLINI